MAGNFDLSKYADVGTRITEFVKDFPNGVIQTFLRHIDGAEVMFEARVFRSPEDVKINAYTSGFAREVEGKSPVNKTSHVENCETSAIGRALANMAYGTDVNRASRSEMLRVNRMKVEHESFLAFIKEHFDKITTDHKVTVDGGELGLREFLTKNGTKLKEQFKLARTAVHLIEQSLGVTFTPTE